MGKHWFKSYDYPETIISDNERQYVSKSFANFLKRINIRKVNTHMYHPESNGISEQLNQTIAEVMRMFKHSSITTLTKLIENRLNHNFHRTIGQPPIAVLTGHSKFSPLSGLKKYESKDLTTTKILNPATHKT